MEKQVLGYQSPLYGRRTMQLKIEPFNFHEAQEMLTQVDKQSAFTLYSISGGIPQYLNYFSRESNVKAAVINNFFQKDGRLFEEPTNLIKQELRDPANYNSIIAAIAQGHSRLNEIATATKIKATSLRSYLNNLTELEIIERIVPVTEILIKAKNRFTAFGMGCIASGIGSCPQGWPWLKEGWVNRHGAELNQD